MLPSSLPAGRPEGQATLTHACSIGIRSRVGLQSLATAGCGASVGEPVPSRAAARRQRQGCGEMRGLGAISVPPRPSDQPPFATIPVSGCALHRLCVEDICMCSSATHDVLLQTRPLNFARFFFNCLAGVSDPARAHNAECACLHASLHRPQQDSVGECGSSSCPCGRVEKF